MPRRPRRLRRRPGRLRRAGGGQLRRHASPATTTSRSSRCSRWRSSRAARRSPPSGRADVIRPETREFLLGALALGRGRGRRALPRLSARPDLGVRAVRPHRGALPGRGDASHRVSLIGHSHVALSFHRPEGEPASGSTRRDGRPARPRQRRVAAQPRLDRPAARRRPAGGLAGARHDGLDGRVAPRGVRHRGRPGGDPRGAAAGLARRAPAVRPVSLAGSADAAPCALRSWPAGAVRAARSPAAASENRQLIPQRNADQLTSLVDEAGQATAAGECDTAPHARRRGPARSSTGSRRHRPAAQANLRDWLDHLDRRSPTTCKAAAGRGDRRRRSRPRPRRRTPTETATPTPTATADADADAPTADAEPPTATATPAPAAAGAPEEPPGTGGVPPEETDDRRHPLRRPLPPRTPPRRRRHGHRPARARHAAGAPRGGQAARRAPRRRTRTSSRASGARRSPPRGSCTRTSSRSSTSAPRSRPGRQYIVMEFVDGP